MEWGVEQISARLSPIVGQSCRSIPLGAAAVSVNNIPLPIYRHHQVARQRTVSERAKCVLVRGPKQVVNCSD
jgi:hypothetical protein